MPRATKKPRQVRVGNAKAGWQQSRTSAPVAEMVLRSFNTWAFKREQPSDLQLMLGYFIGGRRGARGDTIRSLLGQRPATCSGHWLTSSASISLLPLLARVRGVYAPGAAITLILTDTHAELNGYCRQDIDRYFDEIKAAAKQRDFETCSLGQLVKAAGNLATAAPLDETVSAKMLSILTTSAAKWYRGAGAPEEGALTYLRMNLIEQRVVERAFPGSIFITFNGSDLRKLFPRQLPIFYMYSLRRGVSVKPWFMTSESMKPG